MKFTAEYHTYRNWNHTHGPTQRNVIECTNMDMDMGEAMGVDNIINITKEKVRNADHTMGQ